MAEGAWLEHREAKHGERCGVGRALSSFLILVLPAESQREAWVGSEAEQDWGRWQVVERGGGRGSGDAAPKRGDDVVVGA